MLTFMKNKVRNTREIALQLLAVLSLGINHMKIKTKDCPLVIPT